MAGAAADGGGRCLGTGFGRSARGVPGRGARRPGVRAGAVPPDLPGGGLRPRRRRLRQPQLGPASVAGASGAGCC